MIQYLDKSVQELLQRSAGNNLESAVEKLSPMYDDIHEEQVVQEVEDFNT